MQIGVIGSGTVGGTLGRRWAQAGHEVVFGSRHPETDDVRKLVESAGGNARASALDEAAKAEVILLATPWPATQSAVSGLGDLGGRVLIDATNPLRRDLSGLETQSPQSGGELVGTWAKGAKVVKAFNAIGAGVMANPDLGGRRAALLYCGDDVAAKQTVAKLATEIGFEASDAGALALSGVLESMALLWVTLAFRQGYGTDFAFQLIRR